MLAVLKKKTSLLQRLDEIIIMREMDEIGWDQGGWR